MAVNAQPGCCGTAARLPNRPGSQKLTPFSSANEVAENEITAPIASATSAADESRDNRSRLPPVLKKRFFIVPPSVLKHKQEVEAGRTVFIHRGCTERTMRNGARNGTELCFPRGVIEL